MLARGSWRQCKGGWNLFETFPSHARSCIVTYDARLYRGFLTSFSMLCSPLELRFLECFIIRGVPQPGHDVSFRFHVGLSC